MARKVRVEMLDDIDGSTAAHTVPFSLDGISYEIDLSDGNAAALRETLARFVAAGRRMGGRKPRPAAAKPDHERNQRIRAWAGAHGYRVLDRGRLSTEVVAAFERAQSEGAEDDGAAGEPTPRKKVAAARK